ncbi:MAG: acyltransferase [Clostridia bacterium]|nr:acyltransferase [Clostridia bacterium]
MKRTNETLNAVKGIACMLVVFIHVQFPGMFGNVIVALSRSAVAIFFVVSGYYLYNSDFDKISAKLPVKIKNIAKLTAFAFLLYFVWESFVRFIGSGTEAVLQWYTDRVFTFESLIKVVLTSYDPVVGHLWFLLALLGAYILFIPITKFKLKKLTYILSAVLLEAHIVIMAISGIFKLNINMTVFRSVFFYGLPFVMLGFFLKEYEKWFQEKLSTALLTTVAVAGAVLVVAELLLFGNMQVFNGTIILVASVFLLAVRHPEFKGPKALMKLGGMYSTDVYIYHWLVMELVIKACEILNISFTWFDWIEPVIVLAITIVGVIMLSLVKKILSSLKVVRA